MATGRKAVGAAKAKPAKAAAKAITKAAPKPANAKAKPTKAKAAPKPTKAANGGVVLLSGGNPQIAKGDGDAPVQAFIDAMPGWKSEVGRVLDALICDAVPQVTKAVKWNTPMYGVDGQTFFTGFHCLTKYVKVAFFKGALLTPIPPVESKTPESRYLHIFENDVIDEGQLRYWFSQAAALPGWKP